VEHGHRFEVKSSPGPEGGSVLASSFSRAAAVVVVVDGREHSPLCPLSSLLSFLAFPRTRTLFWQASPPSAFVRPGFFSASLSFLSNTYSYTHFLLPTPSPLSSISRRLSPGSASRKEREREREMKAETRPPRRQCLVERKRGKAQIFFNFHIFRNFKGYKFDPIFGKDFIEQSQKDI